MQESAISPNIVDPIVRLHKKRPFVSSFIFARTNELTNSPTQNASREAATIRGVWPKIRFTANCCSGDIVDAAGRLVTTNAMIDAKISAPNPAQMTLRERLYP